MPSCWPRSWQQSALKAVTLTAKIVPMTISSGSNDHKPVSMRYINSLATGRLARNFRQVIFKLILEINDIGISNEIVLW